MANMRIWRLPANQAWAIVWGDSMVRLDKDMSLLWERRADLVSALDSRGIDVLERGILRARGVE